MVVIFFGNNLGTAVSKLEKVDIMCLKIGGRTTSYVLDERKLMNEQLIVRLQWFRLGASRHGPWGHFEALPRKSLLVPPIKTDRVNVLQVA